MKIFRKIIFVFFVLICFTGSVNAATENDLYEMYCPNKVYDVANVFSRGLQSVSGMNLAASRIAASQVKDSIQEYVQGDIKVKVKSFSATDAKNGRFRAFFIKGKDLNFYSLYLSELNIKTACDFIYLDLTQSPVQLKEPMALDFTAKFTEKDINNIFKTTTYQKYLLKVKYNSKTLKFVELTHPKVSLKDNKFAFSIQVKAPFVKPFIFSIKSGLKIQNNKVKIDNMVIGSNSKQVDFSLSKYFTTIFNPLWFAQLVLNQHNCHLLLKNVKIENEKIIIDGAVFLARS